MPPHFKKCLESHASSLCPIPSKENEIFVDNVDASGKITKTPVHVVSCVNCNIVGHTASSRDCPRRLAIIARKAKNRAEAQSKVEARSQRLSLLRDGVTFAASLGKSNAPNSSTTKNNGQTRTSAPNILNAGNIIQFFGTDYGKKYEKAKQLEPIFTEFKNKAGLNAAMSAWL